MPSGLLFGICLATIAVFGWLDYITGPEIGFSLFYLLPIAAVAWQLGRIHSVLLAVAAAVAWFLAQYYVVEKIDTVLLWNSFTRLVIYVAIAVLVQEVRSDRRDLQNALAREVVLARTDWLTGLANSLWFDERLKEEIEEASRTKMVLCLAYFDLDGFKDLNDRFGHHSGDEILRAVGCTLRSAVRESDLAGRLGGDEFAILFPRISRDAADEIARRIGDRIAELSTHYSNSRIGASIGIALFRDPFPDSDAMIREADRAMYRAKAAGKGTIVWADEPAESVILTT